ncbi:unnamed protein product [Vitrella brassicaformis CCMP3155]|uniref:Uncharacterized protein n=3 Tax=Vitrella brassicaformis TaxID=1169539 RepID=A0A0G4EY37_VITBC|nr:unnamed protein product [Vitrella brassicaformis CCMP3155]|eukprot:CEM03641.1 unnamed protein product [Vitrella brassicaformis CCMP3155]
MEALQCLGDELDEVWGLARGLMDAANKVMDLAIKEKMQKVEDLFNKDERVRIVYFTDNGMAVERMGPFQDLVTFYIDAMKKFYLDVPQIPPPGQEKVYADRHFRFLTQNSMGTAASELLAIMKAQLEHVQQEVDGAIILIFGVASLTLIVPLFSCIYSVWAVRRKLRQFDERATPPLALHLTLELTAKQKRSLQKRFRKGRKAHKMGLSDLGLADDVSSKHASDFGDSPRKGSHRCSWEEEPDSETIGQGRHRSSVSTIATKRLSASPRHAIEDVQHVSARHRLTNEVVQQFVPPTDTDMSPLRASPLSKGKTLDQCSVAVERDDSMASNGQISDEDQGELPELYGDSANVMSATSPQYQRRDSPPGVVGDTDEAPDDNQDAEVDQDQMPFVVVNRDSSGGEGGEALGEEPGSGTLSPRSGTASPRSPLRFSDRKAVHKYPARQDSIEFKKEMMAEKLKKFHAQLEGTAAPASGPSSKKRPARQDKNTNATTAITESANPMSSFISDSDGRRGSSVTIDASPMSAAQEVRPYQPAEVVAIPVTAAARKQSEGAATQGRSIMRRTDSAETARTERTAKARGNRCSRCIEKAWNSTIGRLLSGKSSHSCWGFGRS